MRTRRFLSWAMLWTLIALFFASESYLAGVVAGRPLPWLSALAYALPDWYAWAVLAPVIVWLGRLVPVRSGALAFGLVFHVAASALAALAHAAGEVEAGQLLVRAGLPAWAGLADGFAAALRLRLRLGSHLDLVTYWAILLTSYAVAFIRRERELELRASRLAAGLAQSRLELLRVQLDPHFLFNALNAIAGLVHSDAAGADRMIARLGELLRFSLEGRGRHEVPLREELRLLEAYADIERARFRGRATIDVRAEPEVQDALVPSLLLQPLVENAVRHGIAPRPGPGRVSVEARRAGSALEILVCDDGIGLSEREGGEKEAGGEGLTAGGGGGDVHVHGATAGGEDVHVSGETAGGGGGEGHGQAAGGGRGDVHVSVDDRRHRRQRWHWRSKPAAGTGTVPGGRGLEITRERLEQLYGLKQRLDIVQPATGGLEVHVTIPLRRAGEAVPAEAAAPGDPAPATRVADVNGPGPGPGEGPAPLITPSP